MAITAQIKYRSNPRYHADSIPVVFGSGSDSRILYDGGNDEWTVQTKNASGTFVDRLRIEANTNTPDIDAVDLPIKWPAGRAVTAGDYSIGRDADGTKQQHFNVPTGAGWEWSINDSGQIVYTAGALAFQQATTISTTTGDLTIGAAAGADVLIGDDVTIIYVDGGENGVGIGRAPTDSSRLLVDWPAISVVGPGTYLKSSFRGNNGAITVTGAASRIATVGIGEPNITISGGSVVWAPSLFISSIATEATNNSAILVGDGVDADISILMLQITGVPTLSWDESLDSFLFNKGLTTGKNNGTANTGVTAAEYGDGYQHTTVLTVSQVNALTIADNAAIADGRLLYTFPAGAIVIDYAYMTMGMTAASAEAQSDTPDVGLGTVIASGAVSVLSGTATFEDIITGQTATDANGTATVKTTLPTAGNPFVIESGDAHTLHFNVADTWADDTGGDLTADISGTVVLVWRFLA